MTPVRKHLLNYAYYHEVTDYVVEKLTKLKSKTYSKTANRKISKLALRE